QELSVSAAQVFRRRSAFAAQQVEQRNRLRHGFENQHARKNGVIGEVTEEAEFVAGNVLQGPQPLATLDLHDAVDHKEWEAVREHTPDLLEAQRFQRHYGCGHLQDAFAIERYDSTRSVTAAMDVNCCSSSSPICRS